MTNEEYKEIVRVCGKDFEEKDIPAYIRDREFKEEMSQIMAEERAVEELEAEVE